MWMIGCWGERWWGYIVEVVVTLPLWRAPGMWAHRTWLPGAAPHRPWGVHSWHLRLWDTSRRKRGSHLPGQHRHSTLPLCGICSQRKRIHESLEVNIMWPLRNQMSQDWSCDCSFKSINMAHMMPTWCSHDAHMILTWCSHDAHMMLTWCPHEAPDHKS